MKKYLLLILTFLSVTAHADNWLNKSKILSSSIEAYSLQSDCESISKEKCYNLGNYPSSVYSESTHEVDDINKPVFEKNGEIACLNVEDCQASFPNFSCSDPYSPSMDLQNLKLFCQRLIGYEKKVEETIILDSAKLSAYQTAQSALSAQKAYEANLAFVVEKINCGKKAIAALVLRNVAKNLTTNQIASMNATYAPIEGLLSTASLATAKAAVQAITVDGVIITEADKTAVITEIDKCL